MSYDRQNTMQQIEKISAGVDRMQATMNDIKTQINLITIDIFDYYKQQGSEQKDKSG